MKRFRTLFFIVFQFSIFNSGWVNAQSTPVPNPMTTISIASPTAGSLGKFGDMPISYHTGVPQISIPIYSIEAGPIKIPISLSYHASGVKVQEPAGWVGMNWALDAGGVITRSVQGLPDEVPASSSQQKGYFRDYGYSNYLYAAGQENWTNFIDGTDDGEPDFFFYNFAGHSGKFYFRDDRTPIIVPEEDLKIIPGSNGSTTMDYFTIITPDGTQYIFGNSPGVTGQIPIETTNSMGFTPGGNSHPPVSSWFFK